MSRFYLFLWLRWVVRLTFCSISLAALLSFLVTAITYVSRGLPEINMEVVAALIAIFKFWFPLFFSFTVLIALFRGLKYIFENCINGFELKLLSCDSKEIIEKIGYGDLLKVWRKWLMLLIWLVGSIMVFALICTSLFASYSTLFEWFNIYWLYGFILISGYFSFLFMSSRCKKVKIIKC